MQNKTLELLYVSCWHFHEIFSKRTNLLVRFVPLVIDHNLGYKS